MKTLIKKYITISIAGLLLLMVSCVKENPLEPVAEFTTSLTDNTAYVSERFYIYLDKAQGEFLTLFSGKDVNSRYDPENETVKGDFVDVDIDSLEIGYYIAEGKYRLTLVAASSGNWAEDYVIDTFGIDITVIDRVTDFAYFRIDGVDGLYNEDGTEIYFFGHKNQDLTQISPDFKIASADALVTIDGLVQTAKKSLVDFSPITPGDSEGRPVVYKITSPSGASKEFTVKYILTDSRTGKVMSSLTTEFGTYTLSAGDETNKQVKVIYPEANSSTLTKIECSAVASAGAKVYIDNSKGEPQEITAKGRDVDLTTATVTVEAENLTTSLYSIIFYPVESITSMAFTESNGNALFPTVEAVIDGTTLTFDVLAGTDLTKIVVEFTGPVNNKLFLGAVELASGVTVADFSGSPVLTQKAADGTLLSTYTIVIE